MTPNKSMVVIILTIHRHLGAILKIESAEYRKTQLLFDRVEWIPMTVMTCQILKSDLNISVIFYRIDFSWRSTRCFDFSKIYVSNIIWDSHIAKRRDPSYWEYNNFILWRLEFGFQSNIQPSSLKPNHGDNDNKEVEWHVKQKNCRYFWTFQKQNSIFPKWLKVRIMIFDTTILCWIADLGPKRSYIYAINQVHLLNCLFLTLILAMI